MASKLLYLLAFFFFSVRAEAQAPSYYQLLRVSKNASIEEIKSAYLKLAQKYLVDEVSNDPIMKSFFEDITKAYKTLTDPKKKKAYDLEIKNTSSPVPEKPYCSLFLKTKMSTPQFPLAAGDIVEILLPNGYGAPMHFIGYSNSMELDEKSNFYWFIDSAGHMHALPREDVFFIHTDENHTPNESMTQKLAKPFYRLSNDGDCLTMATINCVRQLAANSKIPDRVVQRISDHHSLAQIYKSLFNATGGIGLMDYPTQLHNFEWFVENNLELQATQVNSLTDAKAHLKKGDPLLISVSDFTGTAFSELSMNYHILHVKKDDIVTSLVGKYKFPENNYTSIHAVVAVSWINDFILLFDSNNSAEKITLMRSATFEKLWHQGYIEAFYIH